ncbi:MAG TPA: GNAT family N-acetyltransferase [Kofleriaceae bacterium]|jgi:ribosomal protein S18 acetylase RimI-like enzyme
MLREHDRVAAPAKSRMKDVTKTVRRADLADRDALVAIDEIAIEGNDARRAQLEAALGSGHGLVFDAEEGIAGFVVTVPKVFFGRDFVELLMVDRMRRRAGIGRRLLQAAVRSASTSRVFTSTNRSNSPMRALLDSEGWSLSGELRGLDDGDPELVYFIDR